MDDAYLQSAVGEALTEALSMVVVHQPADPVEWVGLYLLKWIENQEIAKKRKEELSALERDRNAYLKQLEEERKRQEEEERRRQEEERRLEEERLAREAELMAQYEAEAAAREEELRRAVVEAEKKAVEEDGEVDPLAAGKLRLARIKADLLKLDKGKIAEIRQYKKINKSIHKTIKAVFYVLDTKPKDIKTWDACRMLLGKRDIIKEIQDYDPVAVQKKIKFINATKATKGLTEEVVKKSSFAVWLLYQWVMTSWDLRKQAVELRKKAVDEGKEDQPLDEEGEEDEEDAAKTEDEEDAEGSEEK